MMKVSCIAVVAGLLMVGGTAGSSAVAQGIDAFQSSPPVQYQQPRPFPRGGYYQAQPQYHQPQFRQPHYYQPPQPQYVPPKIARKRAEMEARVRRKYGYQPPQQYYYQPQPRYYQPAPEYYYPVQRQPRYYW